MGYLFSNVNQLAGFFLGQTESARTPAPSQAASGSEPIDFESLLKAISKGLNPESFHDLTLFGQTNTARQNEILSGGLAGLTENNLANTLLNSPETFAQFAGMPSSDGVVSSESALMDSKLIEVYLARSGGTTTLEINSGDNIQSENTAGSYETGKLFVQPIAGSVLGSLSGQSSLSNNVRISFSTAEFLAKFNSPDNNINVDISAPGQTVKAEQVDLSSLISIIKNCPDPVKVEVPVIQTDIAENSVLSKPAYPRLQSNFIFDLRQAVEFPESSPQREIEGVLTLSGVNPAKELRTSREDNFRADQRSTDQPRVINANTQTNVVSTGDTEPNTTTGNSQNKQFTLENILAESNRPQSDERHQTASQLQGSPKAITSQERPDIAGLSLLSKDRAFANGLVNNTQSNPQRQDAPVLQLDELKSAMLYAIKRDLSTIRLKLQPEELGSVDIKLSIRDGILAADMKVNNIHAARALNSGINELRAGLEQYNLKVHDINITIDNHSNADSGASPDGRTGMTAWNDHNRQNGRSKNSGQFGNPSRLIRRASSTHSAVRRGWIDLKA